MPLATTSRKLYRAQRRRLRTRRWLGRLRFSLKCLGSLAVCAALAWGGYTVWPLIQQADYFHVRTIDISGNDILTRQYLLYLLAVPDDVSLLQLDLQRMGSRLARHPSIRQVDLRRRLPDTLVVTIQEHAPYMVVRSAGQRLVLDREGTVLRAVIPEQDANLPELILDSARALLPGMRLQQPELPRAVALLQSFQASALAGTMRPITLTVEPSGSSVWQIESQPFTLRFGEGPIETQLERLPLVLRYITQQGLAVKTIDLSYRRKIIVTPAS